MPILPIDIQTLLSQLGSVGKEQAVQQEGSPHAQAVHGAALARQAQHSAHSVNQTREVGEGLEKVREERERARKRRPPDAEKAKDHREEDPEVFEDPDLGRHVDLTG